MISPSPLKFAVAPHFHLPSDWSRRILVGSGIAPHDLWRAPTPEELAGLTKAEQPSLDSCICLFALPQHLLSRWWAMLEQSAGSLGDGNVPGFEDFTARVREFLAFKQLRAPDSARFDAVVHAGELDPLVWGVINVSDEEAAVVLCSATDWPESIRLILRPGEGIRLPGEVSTHCRTASDDPTPQVMLTIRYAR